MKKLLILLLLVTSVSAYTISDYPDFFLENNRFTALYVVGEEAPSLDVVSATLISTALAQYPNVTTAIGTSKIDSEIQDITAVNAIVIGNACENSAAYALEGNPNPCYANLGGGAGYIKLFEQQGKVQLLITGLTPEDRHAAAKYLAEQPLDNLVLTNYVLPTNTGSSLPFFIQRISNNSASGSSEAGSTPSSEEFANEEEVEQGETSEQPVEQPEQAYGEYEPLEDVPEQQGFFGRLWSWFTGLFS